MKTAFAIYFAFLGSSVFLAIKTIKIKNINFNKKNYFVSIPLNILN